MRSVVLGSVVGVLAGWLSACFNECDFWERCGDAQTLLQCGGGVDQQINRQIYEIPCGEENPICVEGGNDRAACVAATTCDASVPSRCDGDRLVTCGEVRTELDGMLTGPFEQVVSCPASIGEGATCLSTTEGARCGFST